VRPPSESACLVVAAGKVRFVKIERAAGLGVESTWGDVPLVAENVDDEVDVVLFAAVVVGAASEGGTKVFVVVGAVGVGVKEDLCAKRKKKRRKGPISSLAWVRTRLM
jgi:hypothetical protein